MEFVPVKTENKSGTIGVGFPPDTLEAFHAARIKYGMNANAFAVQCIQFALANLPKEKE